MYKMTCTIISVSVKKIGHLRGENRKRSVDARISRRIIQYYTLGVHYYYRRNNNNIGNRNFHDSRVLFILLLLLLSDTRLDSRIAYINTHTHNIQTLYYCVYGV